LHIFTADKGSKVYWTESQQNVLSIDVRIDLA